ncbi:MAG: heavy-metal-associated domain-containing protein [Proteobacteria bacterium]|nr:heavy-metal-associated domain-containing protein [Pseudomonadota bacterium]
MSTKLIVAALLLLSGPVFASDYVVHVHGLVCSFCAQGVTKKVSRLPFIDQSKYTKGVKVEIEKQKLTIAVIPDWDLDIPALFEAITSGGYEPVDIWTVTATGELDELVENKP